MRIVDLIAKKRDGHELNSNEINWFITEYTADQITDYQAAAFLMAIYLQGMSRRETVELTLAMARSGDQLDLHDIAPFIVDKHSSGGVGDKTTLIVQPLVAACGVPVGKMSGRGLGSSGGTLDKMESITGWRSDLSLAQFKRQLGEIGLVLAGQTAQLAPADGKLYALRDVTATVSSTPLIAGSIMSKKLAAGADGIVLDVKLGNGAFMPTVEAARELAEIMVAIGVDAGRKMVALLSDMNQPLGVAIGNALEVKEAVQLLQGEVRSEQLWLHCRDVAAQMIYLSGKAATVEEGADLATQARDSGAGWEKFKAMVAAQGGNVAQIEDTNQLPAAKLIETVTAMGAGYVVGLDTEAIGWATVHLGAGRLRKSDQIDHAVGVEMGIKVGDKIPAGFPLYTIHANDQTDLDEARKAINGAIMWSDSPVEPLPHSYGTITGEDIE